MEILPFFVIFLLFNKSCNENNLKLQKWVFAAVSVLYITMAIFAYHLFIDFFLMVTISSMMIAISYIRHKTKGIKNYLWALTPTFLAIVQTFAILLLSDYYTNIYDEKGLFPSIYRSTWMDYETMGIAIFLAVSLISNFIVLTWRKWWLPVIIVTLGMTAYSTHFFWNSEFFVRKVPTVIVSTYAFGVLVTYLINFLFTKFNKSHNILKERSTNPIQHTNENQGLLWKVVLISTIQTVILFFGSAYFYLRSDEGLVYAQHIQILVLSFFPIFLLFNTACIRDIPKLRKWIFAIIAALYITIAISTHRFLLDIFFIITISSIMIALSYAKFAGGKIKEYILALTPIFLTIVQIITLLYVTDYYDSKCSNIDELSYSMGCAIFLVVSLITNFIVTVWRKWWLTTIIAALTIASFSTYLYSESETLAAEAPVVITLIYVVGGVITFLIKLLLAKFNTHLFKKIKHSS